MICLCNGPRGLPLKRSRWLRLGPKAEPVPGHEALPAIPTFMYQMVRSRKARQLSTAFLRQLRDNVRYWRKKNSAATTLWKRRYWQTYRGVFLVWHRYARLMMSQRLAEPIPQFDERLEEWDRFMLDYMCAPRQPANPPTQPTRQPSRPAAGVPLAQLPAARQQRS